MLFCFVLFFLIAASYITSGWPLLNMNLLRHLPRESLRRKLERGVKWCDIVHVDYKRQRGFREVVADGEWERGILLQKVGQIWGSAMRELWLLKDKESWRVGEWVIFGNSVEAGRFTPNWMRKANRSARYGLLLVGLLYLCPHYGII